MNLLGKNKLESKDKYAYKLIIPSMVCLFVTLLVPLIFSLFLSTYDWDLMGDFREFVGMNNFINTLSNPEVIHSLKITFIFVFVSVSVELILGTAIALLLNRSFKGYKAVRVIMLLPMMISPTILALSWRLILHSEKGVLNYLLILLGLDSQTWLGGDLAFLTLIAIKIWISTPFIILMVLAGLQAVPEALIDAAIVDGANWWQRLTKISFPIIKPIISVALIFETMFALRNFALPWVLTGGGPANKTNVFAIELYRQAFSYYQIGNSSAMSLILVVITVILSIFYIRMLSREPLY